MPAPPPDSYGAKNWVGFGPSTTYRLTDGTLRKRLPVDDPTVFAGVPRGSDELDEVFYATADQMSVAEAERFARALARYRAPGSGMSAAVSSSETQHRTLLDVVGVRDPRRLDVDRLWAPRRTQGRDWMRFPVGLDDNGQVIELDLKEGSQQGMNMHSLFIGTTGAGKSEGIITEVTSLALTHSPEVVNVVFSDFKLKSAAGTLERFPHVVASVSNLADERHLVGRMHDALDGELDRRGALCAALDGVPDLTAYNQRRLTDPSLPPVPALFVICDEYQEMLADPEWGPKFQKLFWRIVRQGRAYHMFLQLVGQTVDTQKLRDTRKLLGFTIAARTGREEDSREAIGSTVAAHLPEKGAEGHRLSAGGAAPAARVPVLLFLGGVHPAGGHRGRRTGAGRDVVRPAAVHGRRGRRYRRSAGRAAAAENRCARSGSGAAARRGTQEPGHRRRGDRVAAGDRCGSAAAAVAAAAGGAAARR